MWRVAVRAKVVHPYWRRRFHSFGAGSIFHDPVWLYGAHKIAIGEGTIIGMGMLSVEFPAWRRPGPAISIGNRVGIRQFSTITAAESVVIEDDVGIGAHSFVSDLEHLPLAQDHAARERVSVPSSRPPLNPAMGGELKTVPTRIGRGTLVFERVAVLSGSTIGKYCVIGTNSVVRGDIPDYSVAVGAPARVVGSTRDE